MTCIVGLVEGDTIYLGGDSLASDEVGSHVVGRADEKVFINDEGHVKVIMGFCGSFRAGQLLRHAFVPPDQPTKHDDMTYMVVDFVDALRTTLKEKGALKKDDEEETHPMACMVGYKGHLYAIEEDFDVGRPQDNFYAIGAGGQIAFGALHATRNSGMPPRERVKLALEAAEKYNAACRGPHTILELKRE
jgi:ATP-dependent protease HslVU (ClpYQ) peptidase subunit